MNASSDIEHDLDQASVEYGRLKPLREIEKLVLEGRPKMGLVSAIFTTMAIVWIAGMAVESNGFAASQELLKLFFMGAVVTGVALTWVAYARSASHARWAMMATLLRNLSQEMNELRAAKK